MIQEARLDPGIHGLLVKYASQSVLAANGFVRTGGHHDVEDGTLLSWASTTPSS